METVPAGGITQLSELLERLTEELLPVSAKAQKKVRIPEGLDLDTPLAPLELPQEIEPTGDGDVRGRAAVQLRVGARGGGSCE